MNFMKIKDLLEDTEGLDIKSYLLEKGLYILGRYVSEQIELSVWNLTNEDGIRFGVVFTEEIEGKYQTYICPELYDETLVIKEVTDRITLEGNEVGDYLDEVKDRDLITSISKLMKRNIQLAEV